MRYVLGFVCVLALGLVGCSGGDGVACVDNVCPCTEAGIRAAIEVGGEDPYTFDCDGARTIVTEAEIVIDNDVILDGEGQLTVDGNETHRVFSVPEGTTAELRGFTITRGALFPNPEANVGGIENLGTLTMVNSTVSGNVGAGIVNGGTLTATSITVRDNPGGGIDNEGALTLNSSSVEVVSSISGPLTIANSTLGKVFATAGLTLTYSTVVGEGLRLQGGAEVLLTSNIVEGGCGCGAFGPADCADYITSNGYNIESPGDTCGFDQSTDRPETTPAELNLGPLTDNGGPTLTHKPGDGDFGEGSVAIDHIPEADCTVDTDQRGEPRPVVIVGPESCDVGSVEVQP